MGLRLRSSAESAGSGSAVAPAPRRTANLAANSRSRSALTELHSLAPEAVAPRATEPVAREELDRGRRAYPPPRPPYSPTALAAFSRNKEPSLMYRRSIAVPLWPVCSAMTRSGTPAAAAEVAKPARSE